LLKALIERVGAAPLLVLFTAVPDFQPPWPESRVAMLHVQAGDRIVEDACSREAIDANASPADDRRIHEETAAALEQDSAEPEPVRLALLCHHYAAAGRQAAAIDCAQRLALLNLQHGAYAEALGGLRQALDGLATLPEGAQRDRTELGLQGLAIPAMMMLHGHADPALETAARRVVALADALGDDPQTLPVLLLLSRHYHYYSQRPGALALAKRHVALAERLGDTDALMAGLPLLAQCHQVDGGFDRSEPLARRALDLYDPAQHGHHVATYGLDSGVYAHLVLFYDDWHFGYPDRSLQHARQALNLARRLEHANTISVALMYLMWAHQLRGERDAVLELGRETRTFCERHGISPLIGSRTALMANWAGDEIGASYALIDGNLGVSALLGMGTYFTPLVAEVELRRGNHVHALALIDASLALADACNEGFRSGQIHCLKGSILWQGQLAEPATVEQAFQRSLAIAREQASPMQELITRTQWYRFICHNGGDDTAMRQALGEVYGRFSEGFDTEPLREARAVLDGV
jgi:adenylate cyclase